MQTINKIKADIQPLLTIAIPTYNRAGFLDINLKKISEELIGLSENQRRLVNVYISNNASTDDTSEIIKKYNTLHTEIIRVINNSENIGADLNIAQCYESACTPYVWILGDDDLILPGSLGLILNVLLKERVDILYLNHYWFKDNYKEKLIPLKNPSVSKFHEALDFAKRTNVMLSFISGLIVRTGVGMEYRNTLATSNLVQFSWVLPLLCDGTSFAVLENVVVAARGGNSGGYGVVKVFGENLTRITDNILKDKPEVARAIQNGTIIVFFPGFINAFRKGCSDFTDKEMAFGLKQAFGDNWRYYLFLAPLLNMPLYFSRCYYYLVRLCSRLFGSYLI